MTMNYEMMSGSPAFSCSTVFVFVLLQEIIRPCTFLSRYRAQDKVNIEQYPFDLDLSFFSLNEASLSIDRCRCNDDSMGFCVSHERMTREGVKVISLRQLDRMY